MRQIIGAVAALAFLWALAGSANAAGQSMRSPAEEYSTAEDAFRDGRVDIGVQALERAARQGSLYAMLRLGNLYREGKLVPKDEVKACGLYSLAADLNVRLDKFYAAAHLVAEAFRRAGMCYAKGLDAPGWEKNVSLAAQLFHQAGVMLDDPIALYELGKLYLNGDGEMLNPALAARHLEAAARKRYPPAQALLGTLMCEGKVIKQRPASGLALLMLAKAGASPEDRAWISRAYDEALLTASKDQEREAVALVDKWRSVYGDQNIIQTATPAVPSNIPPPAKAPGKERDGPVGTASAKSDKEQYGSQPTGGNVPPTAAPPVEP